MDEFIIKHGEVLFTLGVSLITALIARLKEKKALRKSGVLKDKIYYSANGHSDFHKVSKN